MFEPTDEQIEALTGAVGRHLFQKSGVRLRTADEAALTRRIIESPAFQAIIRAAQAEAWERGAAAGWNASGEGWNNEHATGTYDSTWDGMVRSHADHMPPNPYRESADV